MLKRAELSGTLGKNLWLIPPVRKCDLPNVLAATSVATSLCIDLREAWDNSANKFFDALAAGRPVMINHKGWLAELLEQSGAGLVVPPRDAETAAQLLREFISDKDRLMKAGQASAMLAETMFDRDKLAEQLRKVLEEVVCEIRA